MRNRVLFVDDNKELLHGLQRMLRPMREEWEMTFVPGGQEAVEEMQKVCFDVVVSDMRMPGMDGAELLSEVKRSCPRSVRLVLSGQADLSSIISGIRPIHQYLAKPCGAESLIEIIVRTCKLRDLLKPTNLQEAVSRASALPAEEGALDRVSEELKRDIPNIEVISSVIAADVGMASKVLQLVNSAFFGSRHALSDPREAARIIGAEVLRPLVLEQRVFDPKGAFQKSPAFLSTLTQKSRSIARMAAEVARDAGARDDVVNASYAAGLLHGVGKLVLREEFVDQYLTAMLGALQQGMSAEEAEHSQFGATYHQVGAYLLGLWGLPASVSQAVEGAHQPAFGEAPNFTPLTALHVAGALHSEDQNGTGRLWALDEWYIDMLGLSDKLKSWVEICKRIPGEEERAYEH